MVSVRILAQTDLWPDSLWYVYLLNRWAAWCFWYLQTNSYKFLLLEKLRARTRILSTFSLNWRCFTYILFSGCYILGCIKSTMASSMRKRILPLYPIWSTAFDSWVLSTRKMWLLEAEPQNWSEGWSSADRLEVEVVWPGEEKVLGHLITAFQYLKGVCKKNGDKLFSRACCNKT